MNANKGFLHVDLSWNLRNIKSLIKARSHWVTATATASSYFCHHEWVVWNPMGDVHTGGGDNGNGNDVIMEWVGYPFCSGNGNGNIYVLGCCHCHCHWCPPVWTLTTENKVAVAVDAPQCERALNSKVFLDHLNKITKGNIGWYCQRKNVKRIIINSNEEVMTGLWEDWCSKIVDKLESVDERIDSVIKLQRVFVP